MFEHMQWEDEQMWLNGVLFRLEHNNLIERKAGDQFFGLYKVKGLYDQYESLFARHPGFQARNMVEIGIWDGGSVALWNEIFRPEKIVGIDLKHHRTDSDYFKTYVEERNLEQTVKTYWGIDQADREAVRDICQQEFSDSIDLIIDDASHLYEQTKTSFEVLFPRLREGGLYIIEDWAWMHWSEFDEHPHFSGQTGMTQLIVELAEMIGSARGAQMASLVLLPGLAAIERGALQLSPGQPFHIDHHIRRRGTPVTASAPDSEHWYAIKSCQTAGALSATAKITATAAALPMPVAETEPVPQTMPVPVPVAQTVPVPERETIDWLTHMDNLYEFCRRIKRHLHRGVPDKKEFLRTRKEEASFNFCQALFDAAWYLQQNPDVLAAGMDPWVHFGRFGARERRKPNPLFDTDFYLQQNPDVAANGRNPLEHYLRKGANQGCNPNPLFDSLWYRRNNPEVAVSGLNPLVHYIEIGWKQGCDPGPAFDGAAFALSRPDIPAGMNPLAHYLLHGKDEHWTTPPALFNDTDMAMRRQASYYMNPGPGFEVVDSSIMDGAQGQTKAIAFYLPQFHPIAENDSWWGTGFTEWRNVTRAQPRFLGHYQPRLPRDLGFYDLCTPGLMAKQVELARNAGLFGFCFYYYFFDGKKLLHTPCSNFVADETIDFPFCFLWANESWCRLWDGGDESVLLRQSHDRRFERQLLDDLAQYFAHRNYIRVKGRPLFFLYRPDLLSNAAATIARWREDLQRRHGENPFFLMCQTFASVDPRSYGFDGALEFPPHKLGLGMPQIKHLLRELDPDFTGEIYSYPELVERSLHEAAPDFDLIRTVLPSWDNEARRRNCGRAWHGSTPQRYEKWLQEMIKYSIAHPFQDQSFVFINAWNEWAEGAYLEPDIHWGAAYLNATARAIAGVKSANRRDDQVKQRAVKSSICR